MSNENREDGTQSMTRHVKSQKESCGHSSSSGVEPTGSTPLEEECPQLFISPFDQLDEKGKYCLDGHRLASFHVRKTTVKYLISAVSKFRGLKKMTLALVNFGGLHVRWL